ncbi:MAG: L-seryl-tRNA(Sec) selenium transferase [Actinomycetota bacterium]
MRRTEELQTIPQVDRLLREIPELAGAGHAVARWIVRNAVDAARARAMRGEVVGDVRDAVLDSVRALGHRGMRRVINATGVVLHTNLGRAPLSRAAVAAVVEAAGAATVEFDLETGERARRAPVAAMLAAALCDAEDALIVNNNAAALMLSLAAIARGREVLVGRGELIEIGGEFRLPDIMEASGAVLREVGTTNRTHLRDYQRAIADTTAAILKVHPSNYQVTGFTTSPSTEELAEIARGREIPLLYDTGSGLLAPDPAFPDEPDARSALAAGADLVCFSGDKLLGGPQAGILVGSSSLIDQCRRHPIARAVRADKLTLAAMEATLWARARGEVLPVQAMLTLEPSQIEARARVVIAGLQGIEIVSGVSVPGGGSTPGQTLPTSLIAVPARDPVAFAAALRAQEPPVIARIEGGSVVLDLRTVDPSDDDAVAAALARAL